MPIKSTGSNPLPVIEELGSIRSLDQAMVPFLARLPSLIALKPETFNLLDPGVMISQLPRVTSLQLHCKKVVDIDLCLSALATCSQLTELSFGHALLSDAHLIELLPRLLHLSSLTLIGGPKLTTLRCLSETAHLSHTLLEFELREWSAVAHSELVHICFLSSLVGLTIGKGYPDDACPKALSDEFTPGTPTFRKDHWPNLRQLHRPQDHGEFARNMTC